MSCLRCGSDLVRGLCKDVTCPFSDHLQSCPIGLSDHPEFPEYEDAVCVCRSTGVRRIELSSYDIVIELDVGEGSGNISSSLHEKPNLAIMEDTDEVRDYNFAIDGLESMILACACVGVDVESPAFLEAIETAVEAILKLPYHKGRGFSVQ